MLDGHFSANTKSGEAIAFNDKRALVTGGSSGIGKAIALLLMQCGANVCVIDRDEAGLKALNAANPTI